MYESLIRLACRYDDQQDYFDLNDKWSGKKVSGDAYKPVYIERSKVVKCELFSELATNCHFI